MTTGPVPRVQRVQMFSLPGLPEIAPGDDLGALIVRAMAACGEPWQTGDILVVAQKIVSKAEGRFRALSSIVPTPQAREIAARCGKDARKVQAILDESTQIVRVAAAPPDGIVIARHRRGWVCANAGIDESNLGPRAGQLLLLPQDPDASARRIADCIAAATGVRPGVVVSDTFGRPWRRGLVNIALGLSQVPAIHDWAGRPDACGRPLQVTQEAFADAIAAAAGLVAAKDAGLPVVLVRGLAWTPEPSATGRRYVRSKQEDLFP